MLTQERLKEVLYYQPLMGIFVWRKQTGNRVKRGELSGSNNGGDGYLRIKINSKPYLAHRLAWFYIHGSWPKQLDHINGITFDNRISNLRDCVGNENSKNTRIKSNNKTGIMGVHWQANDNSWVSYISDNSKRIYLGITKDFFEACCRRKSAENKYGFHINHGRTK